MKKILILLMACAAVTVTNAQLQLPQPSPSATVTQMVGLTEITIEYSSPGVKNRTIFGGLLPYNQIWRTGANSSTKISFSRDVTIGSTKVPKGKYALFTIPGKDEFTVILNKDLNVSVDSYKQADDLLRIQAKVKPIEMRERMAFIFSNFSDTQTTIDLEWEKTRVSFDVKVDTETQARENIDKTLGGTWRTYNSAARYHLDNNYNLEAGMKYVDQSLSLKEDWFNTWTKAQLYHAMKNNAEAYKWAQKSKELGDKSENFFFKDQVEKALIDWNTSKTKAK